MQFNAYIINELIQDVNIKIYFYLYRQLHYCLTALSNNQYKYYKLNVKKLCFITKKEVDAFCFFYCNFLIFSDNIVAKKKLKYYNYRIKQDKSRWSALYNGQDWRYVNGINSYNNEAGSAKGAQ